MHELTEVRPGTALDYLAAVREERAPLLAEYGHQLVGLYEVMMNDYEVCTIWATNAEDHVRAAKARDVARGLATESRRAAGDPRFEAWHDARAHLGRALARGAHDARTSAPCAPPPSPRSTTAWGRPTSPNLRQQTGYSPLC